MSLLLTELSKQLRLWLQTRPSFLVRQLHTRTQLTSALCRNKTLFELREMPHKLWELWSGLTRWVSIRVETRLLVLASCLALWEAAARASLAVALSLAAPQTNNARGELHSGAFSLRR